MRIWLAFVILGLGIMGAHAIPPANQIIQFGGGSSASGSGGSCTMNGIFDLTNTCNDIYFIGGLK